MPFEIIDTHIHVWDLQRASYPWLENDRTILNQTYQIELLEQERQLAGVTDGILVQASCNFEDTDLMLEVAEKTQWIKAVVGWLPLLDPGATQKVWDEKYALNPYFKGMRHLIHDEPKSDWLLQEEVVESLSFLAAKKIPFDIVGVNEIHIECALEIANKIPDLKMVFDHLNQPPIKEKKQFGRWGELMIEASKHPGFYAKISGLGTTAGGPNYSKEDLLPYIDFALTHFGVERCFCGGDWPVSLLAGSYSNTWKIYQEAITSLLSEKDAEKIFSSNAKTFYHLNHPPTK
jgi:L-fuconolactonase